MHNLNSILCTVILTMLATLVNAQQVAEVKSVEITFNKTSSIIFPASIVSVDRGSRDVMAQKAQGVHNVLQLKAARENFPETNLTVITADGRLHLFAVRYSRQPAVLAMNALESATAQDVNDQELPAIFTADMTESQMETYSQSVSALSPMIRLINERSHKMTISLRGIYSQGNVMFFKVQLRNKSNIHYDVDYLRLFIRDTRKAKRTASQELLVKPLLTHGNDKTIRGKSRETIVYVTDKFTIPDSKKLYIEVMEKSGGRHLRLTIKNKTIVDARQLSDQ
jgi:conjugative transposon TraN protein